ncbi:hypothetical protein [Lepagella muris]|jgi:hypothetical protein|uniref:Uncharacterized protein n=1 Tax=Lepagella muris TaxID=3032870 RepID=A0AC61RFB9_9BACT|nr:hypothetical protein [Lepagella muris]TGY78818.1 hypothetical protein E5331_08415 [Lepagella muris]THG52258.1 hypothetical protein E5984_07690 [Bacteroidales bacterium]TKC60492.1 hypothetical protein E5359_007940 [Bacteroidales bacterium]
MRFLKYIFSILLLVIALPIITSCSAVTDHPDPCPAENDITLSFTMHTTARMSDGSRADGAGHEEVDSEYEEFEDAVNVNDFIFFIFVGEGDDATLLVKNKDIASSTDPTTMITGAPGSYTITTKIEKQHLETVLGHPARPTSDDEVKFRFLIFANCYSPKDDENTVGGGRFTNYDGLNIGVTTYKEVMDEAIQWGFNMDEIYNDNEGDSQVSGLYKGYIPMFGTNNFTTTERALYASRPDDRIYLGEIDLLRALAKIRVIDNIPDADKDADGYPKINNVVIESSQSHARQLPYDALSYINGNQVHTPNIFSDIVPGTDNVYRYKLGVIEGKAIPEVGNKTVRIGYIPEQRIAHVNGNVNEGMPQFVIAVDTKRNSDGSVEQEVYRIPMTGYKDDYIFEFGNNILRNHIYTLSVNRVKVGVPADITLSVVDWVQQSLTLDYTENVNISDRISWQSGTYENDNTETGELVLLPWHDNNVVEAICTFGISTPIGATWTASLPVIEGTPDAFKFVDESGNLVSTISGTVDGKTLSKLRIVSTDPSPRDTSKARLVVTVSLANGKYMEARICDAGKSYKNYTIVQNMQ